MDRISQLIEKFIQVSMGFSHDDPTRIDTLVLVLDQLVIEAQRVEFVFDESDYDDPPDFSYNKIREVVAPQFPDFGLYNTVPHVSDRIGQTEFGIGDAIDDIVDILLDLKRVEWRFRNTSLADALFDFQLSFRGHWGRHARDLQLYIHDIHG